LRRLENVLYVDARFYEPAQLRKKDEEYDLKLISLDSSSLGYFLIATKETEKKYVVKMLNASTSNNKVSSKDNKVNVTLGSSSTARILFFTLS
jgi:hypothetical protein